MRTDLYAVVGIAVKRNFRELRKICPFKSPGMYQAKRLRVSGLNSLMLLLGHLAAFVGGSGVMRRAE